MVSAPLATDPSESVDGQTPHDSFSKMWKQCEGCGDVNEYEIASHCDDCKDHVIARSMFRSAVLERICGLTKLYPGPTSS